MSKIAIVGSGGWGTAAAVHLKKNGHDVDLWSWQESESQRLRENLENVEFLKGVSLDATINFTSDISCVREKDLVVLVTPSVAIRSTCALMKPHIEDGAIIVILSKGIEEGTLCTLSQIAAQEIPQAKIAVMSGPSHAEEVARGIPTTNIVATKNEQDAIYIQKIFMSDTFRIYTGTDVLGVELGGALKNIIALCAGVTDGIGFGDNTKAALMTRGIKEIMRLGISMGAEPDTFYGMSGIGDLIVTCTSMHSRNRRAGILIGQGTDPESAVRKVGTVEGYYCTKTAYELCKRMNIEMPITEALWNVLFNGLSPVEAITELMSRPSKAETEMDFLEFT